MAGSRLAVALLGVIGALAVTVGPSYGAAARRGLRHARERATDWFDTIKWHLPTAAVTIAGLATGLGTVISGGAAVATAASTSLLRGSMRARRHHELTDSLASLCALLASQAEAAPTVADAITESAKWATGPAAGHWQQVADGLIRPGLEVAAHRFAEAIDSPLGRDIAETIISAKNAGAAWSRPIEKLAEQANDTSDTMHLLRRHVTSKAGLVVGSAAIAAGLIASVAVFAPEATPWFSTNEGQLITAGAGATYAAMAFGLSARTAKETRR